MKNLLRFVIILTFTAPFVARAQPAADAALLQRGRYLANNIGLCSDCHSPRNAQGEFIMEHWLMGSALPFKPTVEMPWAPVAPPIASLPSMTGEQAVKFLMEGVRPDGSRPRPPMPEFRFSREDAAAVVAYLKSLRPGAAPPAATAE